MGTLTMPSDGGSWLDDAVLGHDDDAVADVVAVAIGALDAGLVHQLRAVADARVLVHDDAIQQHVAADAEAREVATDWPAVLRLVEVGAEQDRSADRRAALDVGPDADDRSFERRSFDETPFGDDRLAGRAVAEPRSRHEA